MPSSPSLRTLESGSIEEHQSVSGRRIHFVAPGKRNIISFADPAVFLRPDSSIVTLTETPFRLTDAERKGVYELLRATLLTDWFVSRTHNRDVLHLALLEVQFECQLDLPSGGGSIGPGEGPCR
jgi:hypothetical protein